MASPQLPLSLVNPKSVRKGKLQPLSMNTWGRAELFFGHFMPMLYSLTDVSRYLIIFHILKWAQRIALVSGENIFIASHNGQWSSRDGLVGSI
jgi:hypothetical protein